MRLHFKFQLLTVRFTRIKEIYWRALDNQVGYRILGGEIASLVSELN